MIDLALDRLIHVEELRRDLAAYARPRLSDEDIALVDLPRRLDLDDDDIDHEALCGTRP